MNYLQCVLDLQEYFLIENKTQNMKTISLNLSNTQYSNQGWHFMLSFLYFTLLMIGKGSKTEGVQ